MKKCVKFLGISMLVVSSVIGTEQQIFIEDSSGVCKEINVHPSTPFSDVVKSIDEHIYLADRYRDGEEDDGTMPATRSVEMQVQINDNGIFVKAAKNTTKRNYNASLTAQNQADIYFIVKTLADANLVKVKSQESALKAAGDRIDSVHPLKFLTYVFTSEELKVCMKNLEGRSFVWKGFLKGIVESLTEENAVNNVLPFANDFAAQIGVSPDLFLPAMKAAQWQKFIETLINGVPRKGNSDRYDM